MRMRARVRYIESIYFLPDNMCMRARVRYIESIYFLPDNMCMRARVHVRYIYTYLKVFIPAGQYLHHKNCLQNGMANCGVCCKVHMYSH